MSALFKRRPSKDAPLGVRGACPALLKPNIHNYIFEEFAFNKAGQAPALQGVNISIRF